MEVFMKKVKVLKNAFELQLFTTLLSNLEPDSKTYIIYKWTKILKKMLEEEAMEDKCLQR